MTQRQISHPGLPDCREGHRARLMLDARCAAAGGGYFVECACRHTAKLPGVEQALVAWNNANGRRPRRPEEPPVATVATVVQFPLQLGGPAR